MRTGILVKKIGMTRVYNESRSHNGVTVLKMVTSVVLGKKNSEKDGYDALILGFEKSNKKTLNKPQKEYFAKHKKEPMKKIKEFRVSKENFVKEGSELLASHFVVGQFVDVKSNSVGKGFAGAMKRHNFAGLRASHGVSISHRSHGSTGNSQDPGKVWKGKKMAGQLGNKKTTIQSLEVVSVDEERGLILVKGGVPGSIGSWVEVNDAKKKSLPANIPFPAGVKSNEKLDHGKVKNESKEGSKGIDKNKDTKTDSLETKPEKVVDKDSNSPDTSENKS